VKVDVDVGMVYTNVNTNVDTHLACSIILPIIVTPSRTPPHRQEFLGELKRNLCCDKLS
jgi:hypothetical protein